MGRKPSPYIRQSKMFRIGREDDKQIEDILNYWRARRGFYNNKSYTRSDVINQAIGEYYKIQKANHETDFKYCGSCGNPKNDARSSD